MLLSSCKLENNTWVWGKTVNVRKKLLRDKPVQALLFVCVIKGVEGERSKAERDVNGRSDEKLLSAALSKSHPKKKKRQHSVQFLNSNIILLSFFNARLDRSRRGTSCFVQLSYQHSYIRQNNNKKSLWI